MATMSAFEILGPIMVGPVQLAYGGRPALRARGGIAHGSPYRAASRSRSTTALPTPTTGHGTDRALVAGHHGPRHGRRAHSRRLCHRPRTRTCLSALSWAATMRTFTPTPWTSPWKTAQGAHSVVRGESLGGGRVRVSRINGVDVDVSGDYDTLFVAHRDAPGVLADLTYLLSEARINIAFMRHLPHRAWWKRLYRV